MMATAAIESAAAMVSASVKPAAVVTAMMAPAKISAAVVRVMVVTVIRVLVRVRFRRVGPGRSVLILRGARQPEPEAAGTVGLRLVLAGWPPAPSASAQEKGNAHNPQCNDPKNNQGGYHKFG